MKKVTKAFIAVLALFAIVFTAIPDYSAFAGNLDVNAPVIESVTYPTDQISYYGDFTITLQGYDQEGKIAKVRLSLVRPDVLNYTYIVDSYKITELGDNQYELSFTMPSEYVNEKVMVKEITVIDDSGNSVSKEQSAILVVGASADSIFQSTCSVAFDKTKVEINDAESEKFIVTISGETVTDIVDKMILASVNFNLELKTKVDNYDLPGYTTSEFLHKSANESYDEATNSFKIEITPTARLYEGDYSVSRLSVTGFLKDTDEDINEKISFSMENQLSLVRNLSDVTGPEVVSLEMDKQGQMFEKGEKVVMTLKVKEGDLAPECCYLGIKCGVKDVTPGYQTIRAEEKEEGVYTFTIDTSDLYCSEWSINYLSLYDEKYNRTYISGYQNNEKLNVEDYYFYVASDGETVYPAATDVNVTINNICIDEDEGYWYYKEENENKVDFPNRVTIKQIIDATGCIIADNYKGAKLIGYRIDNKIYQENDVIVLDSWDWVNIFPVYEKMPYQLVLHYVGTVNGVDRVKNETVNVELPANLTYKSLQSYIPTPSDLSSKYTMDGWSDTVWSELVTDEESTFYPYLGKMYLYGKYETFPLTVYKLYKSNSGLVKKVLTTVDVKTEQKDMLSIIKELSVPEDASPMSGWNIPEEYDDYYGMGVFLTCEYIISANYSNGHYVEVRYSIWDDSTEKQVCSDEALGYYLTGSEVTLPAEKDGKTITWGRYNTESEMYETLEGNTFTLSANYTDNVEYIGGTIESGEQNTDTSGESKPEEDKKPSGEPEKEAVSMDNVVINSVIAAIEEQTADGTVSGEKKPSIVVDMVKEDGSVATVVPSEILEAAKGKDVDVVLDMGGYSWTINGNDIKASDLKDINLEVSLNATAIPSTVISSKASEKDVTMQISLTHNGDFGFKASLNVNVGAQNQGKYGNLYYYDSTGKLVFMNAGLIGTDGSVELDFSHASDYVIVVGENRTTQETSNANDSNNSNNQNSSTTDTNTNNTNTNNTNTNNTNTQSPETSDIPYGLFIAIVTAGLLMVGVSFRKKRS